MSVRLSCGSSFGVDKHCLRVRDESYRRKENMKERGSDDEDALERKRKEKKSVRTGAPTWQFVPFRAWLRCTPYTGSHPLFIRFFIIFIILQHLAIPSTSSPLPIHCPPSHAMYAICLVICGSTWRECVHATDGTLSSWPMKTLS